MRHSNKSFRTLTSPFHKDSIIGSNALPIVSLRPRRMPVVAPMKPPQMKPASASVMVMAA
jgi:hypothetical protein